MFIQTEFTPNPDAIKFICGVPINSGDPIYVTSDESTKSPLAVKLFSLGDVVGVFFGLDFITVTKSKNITWDVMKPQVIMVITDHLLARVPIFEAQDQHAARQKLDPSSLGETERQILDIIDNQIRPSVAQDGGDIVYKDFKDGVVFVELRGACSGCPSSTITLKRGIESMLKHYVPSVIEVQATNM